MGDQALDRRDLPGAQSRGGGVPVEAGAAFEKRAVAGKRRQSRLDGRGDLRREPGKGHAVRTAEAQRRDSRDRFVVRRSRQDGVEKAAVLDRRGDNAGRVEAVGEREGARSRHAPLRRAPSGNAAEGRRNAGRTAGIAAERGIGEAIGDGDGAARGRAARRAATPPVGVAVPRAARLRIMRIGA
uniref:hypothetical protein n=1 Tax=Thauera sp. SDU_THAU2 TaxID=3136633 RepID=UPI00311DFB57